MRSFCNAMWLVVATTVMVAMVWMLYGVLGQPMYASEKPELLKPGYIPQSVEAPQIDSKRFSRIEGYLYSPQTGTRQRVELRSYSQGNTTIYTGRVSPGETQWRILQTQEAKPLKE